MDHYNETNLIEDRKHAGRPCSIRRLSLIKSVREKICRNPKRLMNKVVKEAKISRTSMLRIHKEDLKIKPFKLRKQQLLTDKQKEKRLLRSKILKNMKNNELYGATSHTAKLCQNWCKENCPAFIKKNKWLPSLPDLNPLNFFHMVHPHG